MNKYVCNHMWHPAFRDVPPAQIMMCKCGQNTYCPKCGFGSGSVPCDCDGTLRTVWRALSEQVIEEHAELWQRLAEV